VRCLVSFSIGLRRAVGGRISHNYLVASGYWLRCNEVMPAAAAGVTAGGRCRCEALAAITSATVAASVQVS